MFLYCPKCQNLIEKGNETHNEGDIIIRYCDKCKKSIEYYVKYKVISKVKFDDKAKNCYNYIIE